MPEFIFEATVGGTVIVKVNASTKDQAIEIVEEYTAEDWNNAGNVKPSDVHVSLAQENPAIDVSLREAVGGSWEYAADDPTYEEDDYIEALVFQEGETS